MRDRAVVRVFAAHIYGLLTEDQRGQFLSEARRVADEIVVVDAGRPLGVPSEHWQRRSLGGETFMVFRRHFDSEALAAEVDGRPLFSGRFYVVVSAKRSTPRHPAADCQGSRIAPYSAICSTPPVERPLQRVTDAGSSSPGYQGVGRRL